MASCLSVVIISCHVRGQMVAGFDLPPGGRRLHEGDNAFTVGIEPSFLPPCFSVFHLWDRLFVAGYRVRRQPFDDGSQRHAAHARRRRHRHRLARQLTRHVPLAARRWRRRRKTHKGKTLKPNESFKRKESWMTTRSHLFTTSSIARSTRHNIFEIVLFLHIHCIVLCFLSILFPSNCQFLFSPAGGWVASVALRHSAHQSPDRHWLGGTPQGRWLSVLVSTGVHQMPLDNIGHVI